MRKIAHDMLNSYFTAELGHSLALPDETDIARQRGLFLDRFGPDALAKLSKAELLRQIPNNASSEQPMDYWLEFKRDNDFNFQLFGSIAGGSATKFGTWQDRKTGAWRAKKNGTTSIVDISEDAALAVVEERRNEMISAVKALHSFDGRAVEAIDPREFQTIVEAAAPKCFSSAWMHKYLHMNFPQLVTWRATQAYSDADLYCVGVEPNCLGLYAQDLQIIGFWNSLPALASLPAQLRYTFGKHVSPRSHWGLGLAAGDSSWQEMLTQGHLALGPSNVRDLTESILVNKKKETHLAVETAFQDAGLDAQSPDVRNLTRLVCFLKEGDLVALFENASTIVAVGQVTGGYRFAHGSARPHQLPVKWLHSVPFKTDVKGSPEKRLLCYGATNPCVADIEASLLANRIGPWPNFDKFIDPKLKGSVVPPPPPPHLPPLEGIARHVVEMLDRKRQVILYGPPGTGKTYHAERIALEVVARHNFISVPSLLSDRQRDKIYGRDGTSPYIATCTFHPNYSYEDFIEGYRPNGHGFNLEPGIFRQIATAAQAEPSRRFVLIIDEINRGNIPKIFGELITLIEASKRGTTSARLPLSNAPFTVPDNLLLIGTMNTADRSILLLDTALRRRFAFKELMPEPHLLKSGSVGDIALSTWLRALNRRIVEQLGRDGRNLQVGHSYLMPGGKPAATLTRVGEIFRDELWPLLQEYCYEDANKLANILGGLYDRESGNLRLALFAPEREDELKQALIAIVTPEDKKHDADLEDIPDDEDAEESESVAE